MTLCVYTACAGGFDRPKAPAVELPGVDWVCFTDDPGGIDAPPPWRVRPLGVEYGCPAGDARRLSRLPKLLPHRYLPEYERTLWVDAYYQVVGDVRQIVETGLDEHDAAMRPTIGWDCVYEEAATCLRRRLGVPAEIHAQVRHLREMGVPAHSGTWGAGIIARRRTDASERLHEAWWEEYLAGSERDQIALPAAVWRTGARIGRLPNPSRPRRGLYYSDGWLQYLDRTPYPVAPIRAGP